MNEQIYKWQQTRNVIAYVKEKYGDELEFLWPRFDANAIWRNKVNRKWYGLVMIVLADKIGIEQEGELEILDVRFEKGQAREFAQSSENIYPGYHMNKNYLFTIVLDGSVDMQQIRILIDRSYRISIESQPSWWELAKPGLDLDQAEGCS